MFSLFFAAFGGQHFGGDSCPPTRVVPNSAIRNIAALLVGPVRWQGLGQRRQGSSLRRHALGGDDLVARGSFQLAPCPGKSCRSSISLIDVWPYHGYIGSRPPSRRAHQMWVLGCSNHLARGFLKKGKTTVAALLGSLGCGWAPKKTFTKDIKSRNQHGTFIKISARPKLL